MPENCQEFPGVGEFLEVWILCHPSTRWDAQQKSPAATFSRIARGTQFKDVNGKCCLSLDPTNISVVLRTAAGDSKHVTRNNVVIRAAHCSAQFSCGCARYVMTTNVLVSVNDPLT